MNPDRLAGSAGGRRALLAGAALLLCVGTDVRAQTLPDSLPPSVTPEMVQRGREIFTGRGNCWSCHGEDGRGARGVGADLTDHEWWHADGSYWSIVRRIEAGVPSDSARNQWGAMMPPRGRSDISDAELRAVAAYVWTLSRTSSVLSVLDSGAYRRDFYVWPGTERRRRSDSPHGPFITTYLDFLAYDGLTNGASRMSQGAVLVLDSFDSPDAAAPSRIYVGERVSDEASEGGWRYTLVEPDWSVDLSATRDSECHSCHSEAPVDFVMTAELGTAAAIGRE